MFFYGGIFDLTLWRKSLTPAPPFLTGAKRTEPEGVGFVGELFYEKMMERQLLPRISERRRGEGCSG